MRVRLVGALALGLCLLIASARGAAAQTTVAVNYNPLLHELTENSWLGGHADIARYWGPIAAVGEVGANHFDQATVITLAPGVRYAIGLRASKIQPSVQAVVGLWHCSACEVNELLCAARGHCRLHAQRGHEDPFSVRRAADLFRFWW